MATFSCQETNLDLELSVHHCQDRFSTLNQCFCKGLSLLGSVTNDLFNPKIYCKEAEPMLLFNWEVTLFCPFPKIAES